MKNTFTILIGLVLGSALTLTAQPGAGRGPGGPHRYGAQGFPPPIAIFDVDGNGVLSAEEIAAAPVALAALDQDQNNQLTATELCPGGLGRGGQNCPLAGQGQGQGGCRMGGNSVLLRLFDADGDGVLSAAEVNNVPTVLKGFDKNLDGQVSSQEIRPLPGCQAGAGCGQGQGQGARYGQGQGQGRGPAAAPGQGMGQGRRWGRTQN